MKFLIIYLIIINSFAIYIMFYDKRRAKKGYWRVPERNLFIIAALFGSIGILLGMKFFHHKTRHSKFIYGVPAILIIQLYIIYKIWHFLY